MNPRLEELRKRLMPSEPAASSDTVFARNSESAAIDRSKRPAVSNAEVTEQDADARSPQPAEPVAEQKPDNDDAQMATDVAKTTDERAQIVATLFEPARLYRERLSNSFESIRTLHVELGALAQSFEPLGVMQRQVVDFLNAIQTQLAEMAKSLEAAKALRLQLSELVKVLDAGSDLQAQTYELSKALVVALQADRKKGN
jgi:hypothetical protein